MPLREYEIAAVASSQGRGLPQGTSGRRRQAIAIASAAVASGSAAPRVRRGARCRLHVRRTLAGVHRSDEAAAPGVLPARPSGRPAGPRVVNARQLRAPAPHTITSLMKATLRRIVLETARSCCARLPQSRKASTLGLRARGRPDCCSAPIGVSAPASDIAVSKAQTETFGVAPTHRQDLGRRGPGTGESQGCGRC